ncbi:response regulator [Mangrovihabitans endophyticus]|uniref:Response regulatory domain-containing protein n=1 Tax=Mangrovihabitans endophyticus TaxID=1751298 RepID=A0A8J3BYN3_9ACTN|nr:response regulator [Mangrovihabitans endophyticus]GGK83062.1 hypothetical protein GCM10012284_16500 [Mangrovihabitans endophyticus]
MSEPTERPTVLVVDDEEDLRDVMRRMLQRRGIDALTAGSLDEAVAVARNHDGDIAVLVADLGLPGSSGAELARVIGELRPGIGVVYISGLPADIAADKGLIDPGATLVKKPFTADSLTAAVRAALDERSVTTS